MLQSALLGGAVIGVLSALPIVNVANCCCLWIVGGGVLAAYLEQQSEGKSITVGHGAFVGLIAGIVGALVWVFASLAVDVFMAPLQQRMVEEMLRNASDMPPEVRAWLETVGERASTPFRYVAGFLFHLFAGAIFATGGGAIGASYFKRDDVPPALGGTPLPPPLPPQG